MRKLLKILLLFIVCLCSLVQLSAAGYVPATVPNPKGPTQNGWISDPAGYLSAAQAAQITTACTNLKNHVDVEVAVVMLPDYDRQRYDRLTFCQELFNLWGIGGRERNTGVLVFFADGPIGRRDIRIHTGGGMEGLLTDYSCSEMIDDAYEYLSAGEYGNGVLKIMEGLCRRLLTSEAQAELTLGWAPKHFDEEGFVALMVFLTFLFVAVWLLCYAYYRARKCEKCGVAAMKQTGTKIIEQATYKSYGMEELTFTCACCGHTIIKTHIIPRLTRTTVYTGSGHSSGGFGSGGGFSGGSWGGGHSFGGGAGRGF